jgi:lipid-binding SYLF domain-containing protein
MTLSKLYDAVPDSREMVAKSRGVLVFPSVVGGSLGIGAEYGRGALRVAGRTQAYYSAVAGSIGFQAGAHSRAVIYLFNTQEALDKFRNSKGWTVGADATVAAATIGANGRIDTNTMRQPVVGFVLTNVGLEAGVSLQGAKITQVQI